MKSVVIESVKHYSKVMANKNIDVVNSFEFEKCCVSSIVIKTEEYNLKFYINIEYKSLENLANLLFGVSNDELIEDLQKELVNTIGGYFADNFYKKGYSLELPQIEQICDTKYGIYFQNDVLKLSVKLKVD